tara:strand:+ start:566 stop:712 length:147 start_codon:yes stop_codon:yes gene_type:complete
MAFGIGIGISSNVGGNSNPPGPVINFIVLETGFDKMITEDGIDPIIQE